MRSGILDGQFAPKGSEYGHSSVVNGNVVLALN
jgi:hypothetical protein